MASRSIFECLRRLPGAAAQIQLAAFEHYWPVSPALLSLGALALALICLVWWTRERRLRVQREVLRKAYQLGEEILGASSAAEILRRIAAVLPRIFGITHVQIYLYNRTGRSLDAVGGVSGGEPLSIPLSSPRNGTQAGVVACFHYRTLLPIADTSRSPFPVAGESGGPKSLLLIPMFAQSEIVGVFELAQQNKIREFTPDEQALAQHLGNQIGVAIRLLDQRSVREQLFRTEKLAAVGRLISGIVNELRGPLDSISNTAKAALARSAEGAPARDLRAISSEARRASELVTRLVSFAGTEQVQAKPVELNRILRNLIEFREREWKARGIIVHDVTAPEDLDVLGSQGQLEQVFLSLLVHAEQALSDSAEKSLTIRTSLLARKVLVEISYSGPRGGDGFEEGAENDGAVELGVCRSIVAGHGGEMRMIQAPGADPRFEIELPWAPPVRPASQPARTGGHEPGRQRTALVVEPDEEAQRQLLVLLSAQQYRVVPARNADVGLDLAHRLRFDVAFCSVRAPGLNWVELSERLQPIVGAFVLLSDGYDPELAADFEGEGRFVLSKPVDETQLGRVFEALGERRMATPHTGSSS